MKKDSLAWACSILAEHVGKDSFGTITISMASGNISSVRTDINHKPPVDQGIRIP